MSGLKTNTPIHPSSRPPSKVLAIVTVDIMAWVLLRQWLQGLQEAGFEVHIACARGQYYDLLAGAGFTMHPIRFRRTFNVFAHIVPFFELLMLLRSGKFQTVNTHSPVAAAVGRCAAAFAGVGQIIYTVHGFYFHDRMPAIQRKAFVAFEWLLGRWTDGFMFVSDEDRQTAQETGICGVNAHVCTIYNGVELDVFRPRLLNPADELRLKHALPVRPVVGCVGRIVKEKGYREFLEAAILITQKGIDATWMVVGDSLPSDRDQFGPALRRQVQEAGLADRFVFTGMTDQVPAYLALMDIFVLPSYREGFPRSILEAMAVGLPVVATNIRGCREAVVEGGTGFIVPPRDGKALAIAIERLLLSPPLREQMGRQARALVAERYDHRKVRKVFVSFLAVVVSADTNGHVPQTDRPGSRRASFGVVVSCIVGLALGLYVVPGLAAVLVTSRFPGSLLAILAGDAVGCFCLAFIAGWRRAASLYIFLTLLEWFLSTLDGWHLTPIIWLSNLVPTLITLAWLLPLIIQAKTWRTQTPKAQ